MSAIDVAALLPEFDAHAPCGPNLAYDLVFVALEQEMLGQSEVQYGDTISNNSAHTGGRRASACPFVHIRLHGCGTQGE